MSKDAKPAKPAEEGADAPAPKKSKKLLIIIVAAVLLIVLAGGGAAFFLLQKGDPEDEEAAEESHKPKEKEKDKKKKDPHAAPAFIAFEPFTVNLVPEGSGDQFLQVIMSAEIEDAHADGAVKQQMPKIRNNVTMLLSSKKPSELMTKAGKETLADELKDEINSAIEPPTRTKRGELIMPDGPVKHVLFTSFIIQ
jgi:flagellar FliL protein